ncbi:MAG: hypothetical protein LKK39_04510 [Oscillospiraceae bacterium]|nr:hypothetical protein [Oscillospiraceae bacterium]MCI2191173.1 hypothetical protein [Oscillospiraceae bacterium]MCI2206151.1 hypothetical protein [Oscillospiraceae bacterium]
MLTMLVDFQSVLGIVHESDLFGSFKMMGLGMLGILIVMMLLYLLIMVLSKFGKEKKN